MLGDHGSFIYLNWLIRNYVIFLNCGNLSISVAVWCYYMRSFPFYINLLRIIHVKFLAFEIVLLSTSQVNTPPPAPPPINNNNKEE